MKIIAEGAQPTEVQANSESNGAAKPVPGTPEYDQAMVAVARAARGEADTDPAQEDNTNPAKSPEGASEDSLILGKFKTPEDLAKAYQELEKKLGSGKAEDIQKDTPKEEPQQLIAGVPVSELEAEVTSSGDLSAQTREKLTKAGIPGDYIDSYLSMYKVAAAAEKQSVQAQEAEIKTAIGGDEVYNAMVAWAAGNLTPGEIDAFNRQIDGGRDSAMLAVYGLKARFEAKAGKSPRLVGGAPSSSSDVFSDRASFLEAMSDPRYKASESYRNQVAAKLERSRASGLSW